MYKTHLTLVVMLCCLLLTGVACAQTINNLVSKQTSRQHQVPKFSSNKLDLSALIKNGLFLAIKNPETGAITYTKDGAFLKKKDGYFYQAGSRLQGFEMPGSRLSDACILSDVQSPPDVQQAKQTARVLFNGYLNIGDTQPTKVFDAKDATTYNYVRSTSILDNQNKHHELDVYFVKGVPNIWYLHVFIDKIHVALGNIKFSYNGEFYMSEGLDQVKYFPDPKLDPISIALDASKLLLTHTSDSIDLEGDGCSAGDAVEELVDDNGYIAELYTNGNKVLFSKIAVYAR